jgi:hypothetical protein
VACHSDIGATSNSCAGAAYVTRTKRNMGWTELH